MNTAYYYFVASLPTINFDSNLPMSIEEYLEECQRLVSPDDFADMRLALSDKPVGSAKNPLLNEWLEFDRNFRNEIAWFRAVKFNRDPHQYIHGQRYPQPHLSEVVAEASKCPDPLSAEKLLGQVRWQKLSEMEQGQYFDIEFLIIYGLKLIILERYAHIKSAHGKEVFDRYKDMGFPEYEKV